MLYRRSMWGGNKYMNKENLLDFMGELKYKPMTVNELFEQFDSEESEEFKELLKCWHITLDFEVVSGGGVATKRIRKKPQAIDVTREGKAGKGSSKARDNIRDKGEGKGRDNGKGRVKSKDKGKSIGKNKI